MLMLIVLYRAIRGIYGEISIHLMLMLIGELKSAIEAIAEFQYISC